jgi:Leucine-rich repeat (LRR) protein
LSLKENKINMIQEKTFYDLINLEVLNLENNQLTELSSKYLEIQKVVYAFIFTKVFSLMNDGKLEITKLKILNLNKNPIKNIDNVIFSELFKNLNEIYFYNDFYKNILNCNQTSNITIFYQYNQKINSISEYYFRNMLNLTFIHMSSNQIKSIDRNSLWKLKNLKSLILSNNLLNDIKDYYFERLFLLRSLDLSNNSIELIETNSFKDLLNLNILNLKFNKFKSIFVQNSFLTYLNMDFSMYTEITNTTFIGLDFLQTISLRNNKIESIQNNSFCYCYDLFILDLAYNSISYINENTFKGLINLKYLLINNNKLTFIEMYSFKWFGFLILLDLSKNNLNEIKCNIFSNSQKWLIYLDNNKISWIENNAFKNISSLISINLNNNSLNEINTKSFDMLILELMFSYNKVKRMKKIENILLRDILNLDNNEIELIDNDTFIQQNYLSYYYGSPLRLNNNKL